MVYKHVCCKLSAILSTETLIYPLNLIMFFYKAL